VPKPTPLGAALPAAIEHITDRSATEAGVRDAWYTWITQYDVTSAAIIHGAIKEAVTEWLNRHGHEVFASDPVRRAS